MTRKDFKAIANIINNNTIIENDEKTLVLNKFRLINDLCVVFKSLNSRFNKQRFVDACNDNL